MQQKELKITIIVAAKGKLCSTVQLDGLGTNAEAFDQAVQVLAAALGVKYTNNKVQIVIGGGIKDNDFIKAIKAMRTATGYGLKEAKELSDRIKQGCEITIPKTFTPDEAKEAITVLNERFSYTEIRDL